VTLVACQETTRWFGRGTRRRRALGPVSVSAEAGEIVGIVGPNGAGKTTLLRLVAGELAPGAGCVRVGGFPAATAAARRLVGFAPDPPLAPPALTGVEWLSYLAAHRARGPAQRLARLREAIEFGQVGEFVGRRIGEYSRGMAQRLGIAAAVLLAGTVLLLDEALAGVDPLAARDLRQALAAFAATGRLVLVASHELATIERLATRVLVLSRGHLVWDVSAAALLKERVVELALSGGAIGRSEWLLARYDGATRTGDGVAVPLSRGGTVEEVLAACRAERIPVAATRVRYRALEDLLVAAERRRSG
jgi:ABC-2 type transport system ATP-binding protein